MYPLSQLLIADDHPIFRKGLKDVLQEAFPDVHFTECTNGVEALDAIHRQVPDITILDINMPEMNGLDVCMQLLKENVDTKIIMLTMYREKEMIKKAVLSGAVGYVLKDNAIDEIMDCIKQVLEGKKYISTSLAPYYEQVSEEDKKKQGLDEVLKTLSQAELKTLKLVSQNRSTKEIAELLFLSDKTIENYRSRICQKLGLPPRNNSLVLWINENKDLLAFISEF